MFHAACQSLGVQSIRFFVGHEWEGMYFTLPFTTPPDTESLPLTYRYERHLK